MIQLQPFTSDDYDRLISWIDSAEMLMQFAGPAFRFPLTREQLDESLSDEKRTAFKVMDAGNQTAIGHAEIYCTTESAYLGRILIGDESQRGKGIGPAIVAQLLRIAFEERHQTLAALNVFDWNVQAIKCYEKAGFVINPDKKRKRKIAGQTWTVLNMILPKTDWQQRRLKENNR